MITVNELPNDPPLTTMLHCDRRQGNYSANRGDYFACDPEQVLNCRCYEEVTPLVLVKRSVVYEEV